MKVLPSNAILKIERDYFHSRPEWLPLERKLFERNIIVFSNLWIVSNVLFWKKFANYANTYANDMQDFLILQDGAPR